MARIRNLKPDFWTDGEVQSVSPQARLLFAGSWNFTMCDYGHLADDARRLKNQVLPEDDVMMVRDAAGTWVLAPIDPLFLLEELIAAGRIDRIEVRGRTFLHVRRFTDHQKLERRWSPRCAACVLLADDGDGDQDLAEPRPTSRKLSQPRPRTGQDGTGQAAAAAAGAHHPPVGPLTDPRPNGAAAADLPVSIAILRDKLQAHTPLRALRFDRLRPDQLVALEELIDRHGDAPLVDTALRTTRAVPPVHVSAYIGTWQALPPPGQRLALLAEPECEDHPGKIARSCPGCAADRKAAR